MQEAYKDRKVGSIALKKWVRAEVPQPVAFHLYNQYMGGVDRAGQLCSNAHRHLKTVKWPVQVFLHSMQIAGTNTYVLKKEGKDLGRSSLNYTVVESR